MGGPNPNAFTGGNATITAPLNLQTTAGANAVFGAGSTGDAFNRTEIRANGNIAMGVGTATPSDVVFVRQAVNTLRINAAAATQFSGPVDVFTAGQGLQVAEGSNAKQGTSTLAAGTVVVANTSVTANSRIMITGQSLGTVTVFSAYGVSARTPGTSFTILASQATDTSVVAWEIFEPG